MSEETHFGEGTPFTLGLEEELFLVDPQDGRLRNTGDEVVAAIGDLEHGAVKNELHLSQVELITGVCSSVEEAVGQLAELRAAVLCDRRRPDRLGHAPDRDRG